MGEYLFEDAARIPVEVEYASEFRYRNPVIYTDDVVIAISQSGETADTLAAIKLAKKSGAFVFGICNVVGSSIARAADTGAYTHAGPEIGVASTKAFTTQITLLILICMRLGQIRGSLTPEEFGRVAEELEKLPKSIETVLKDRKRNTKDCQKLSSSVKLFVFGTRIQFPSSFGRCTKA